MIVRTRLTIPLVVMLLALHPASPGAQSPQAQPAPVLSSRLFELAWTLNGVKGGVAGDAKTGLIYAVASGGAEVIETDLAGTIRRRIPLPPSPGLRPIGILRLAHFAAQPTLLAFGVWTASVRAFALDGTELWSYPNPAEPSTGIDDVNVVDLDGDGTDEVIIGFNGSTGVHVIDSTGRLTWQSTSIGNVWFVSGGDVLGTGRAQVVTTSAAGGVHVFSDNGAERKDIRPTFYANMVRAGRIPETARTATIVAGGTLSEVTTLAALSGGGVMQWSLQLPTNHKSAVATAWLAPTKPWLAVSTRDGAVHVVDVLRGVIIGSMGSPEPRVEVGWSGSEPDGSPLLLVAGGGTLTAYRVVGVTKR